MKIKSRINIFFNSVLIVCAMSALILIIAFATSFDSKNGYFDNGVFPQAFAVFLIVQAIVALASAVALPSRSAFKTSDDLETESPLFILIGIILIVLSAFGALLGSDEGEKYALLPHIGTALFGLYVFIVGLYRSYEYKFIKLITLYLSIIFPVSIFLNNNLNYGRHINSVENLLTTAFVISFLFYVICEGRRITHGTHSRWHFSSMAITFSTGVSFSAAYMLSYIFGVVNESQRAYEMLMIFFICSYIYIEAKRFMNEAVASPLPEPKPEPVPMQRIIEQPSEEAEQYAQPKDPE